LAPLKKKVPYTGCPTNIVMETPCKKIQETTKSADMKKTETEKNRADTILVFLLQHTSEYRIIFYMCPSFSPPPIYPISQLRKMIIVESYYSVQ